MGGFLEVVCLMYTEFEKVSLSFDLLKKDEVLLMLDVLDGGVLSYVC
jgi:hypothetical protein